MLLEPANRTITTTGVQYPEEMLSANFPVSSLLMCESPNGIIFAFGNAMQLYQYNEKTEETKVIQINGDIYPKGMEAYHGDAYDTQELQRYLSENPKMVSLLYNPYLQLYYRLHDAPYYLEIAGKEGYRGYLYLTVLDADFAILAQENLKWDYRYFGAVPTPQGLLTYTENDLENVSRFTYVGLTCDGQEK